jgi:hypothetical protein
MSLGFAVWLSLCYEASCDRLWKENIKEKLLGGIESLLGCSEPQIMAGRVWIFKDTCWQSVDKSDTSDIVPHTCKREHFYLSVRKCSSSLTSLGAYALVNLKYELN